MLRKLTLFLICGALGSFLTSATHASADGPTVPVVVLHGVLTGADADRVDATLSSAALASQPVVVLDIDSPGGTSGVIERLVNAELTAPVPVIAYVGPNAHADAGALILVEAAHVASAAPSAELGAAHPLDVSGVSLKGIAPGDAASVMAQLATLHGRQTSWPRAVAQQGGSLNGTEALHRAAVDTGATTVKALVDSLDGRKLGTTPLATKDATLSTLAPQGWDAVVKTLAQPDAAYALLVISVLCLGIFIASPATFVLGFVAIFTMGGAIAGFVNLPTNILGLALVALSFAFFALDVKAATHGALGAAGAVAMALGGWRLVDTGMLNAGVSTVLVVITVATITAAYAVIVPKLLAARRMPYTDAYTDLVGRVGTVRETLEPHGYVALDGVLWRATTTLSPQPVGARVRVVELAGLLVTVEPAPALADAVE